MVWDICGSIVASTFGLGWNKTNKVCYAWCETLACRYSKIWFQDGTIQRRYRFEKERTSFLRLILWNPNQSSFLESKSKLLALVVLVFRWSSLVGRNNLALRPYFVWWTLLRESNIISEQTKHIEIDSSKRSYNGQEN